jgi:predicted N-acetyltransferase YhbS
VTTFKVSASEKSDRGAVLRGLKAYNTRHVGPSNWKPLTIVAREGGRIVGGLKGQTYWEWLFVALLWVDESVRGGGIGSRLIRLAEKEAVKRGCRHAWLDTFDFQGPRFYPKLGYRRFARLRDCPVRGRTRHFFTRSLR